MELDPLAADIPAELSALYLRQNKVQEAMSSAQAAIKLEASNREANRVLGTIYAALSESGQENPRGRAAARNDENLSNAIAYLEIASDKSAGESDPNVRATLARLYIRSGAFDKAIPLLTELVNQEPGWQDGPTLLAEAYAGAGRGKRSDCLARRTHARTIRGCCLRSPTSTSANAAGRMRPAPTSARCSARPATSI